MENIIKKGKLENNIYYLPDVQLNRKQFSNIAKHFKFLGGKWKGGKTKGFVFDRDISSLSELLGNNIEKKKNLQFFETPREIANMLVKMAELKDCDKILEPSAGRGAIIKAIKDEGSHFVDYCEIDDINLSYLKKIDNINFVGTNFLNYTVDRNNDFLYDKIIANPPFNKNQDINHIEKMYELLNNKGVLVSVASLHWKISNNRKETYFREWLKNVNAEIIELDEGAFKKSGTNIKACIIKIKR
jgi:predicted RNA methylase